MRQTPFLLRPTGQAKGVFAIRGPRRPNPIGLHLVRIASITLTPPVIAFHGVDMIDDTPVLDIKPWVSRFDQPPEARPGSGWYDTLDIQHVTPSDLETGKKGEP
jgi:tRNA (Thr-GGU) A37 N-methylase